jgi:hypothetical protein
MFATHIALALSAKMAKDKTFDQEIQQEIIPSFAPDSKSDIHGLILTYIHCLDCTVQERWFGVHFSGTSERECDFFMTTEDDYHDAQDNDADEDPKPKKRGRPRKVDGDAVKNKRVKMSAVASGMGKAKSKEPEAGEEAVGSDDNENDINEHS